MQKKLALTDFNAPNDSRDISFQGQEFERDGSGHFESFEPQFHTNMTSQMQSCKTMKKLKCDISGVFCSICLKSCRLLEFGKGISLDFKFHCHGNQNQHNHLPLKKKSSII